MLGKLPVNIAVDDRSRFAGLNHRRGLKRRGGILRQRGAANQTKSQSEIKNGFHNPVANDA